MSRVAELVRELRARRSHNRLRRCRWRARHLLRSAECRDISRPGCSVRRRSCQRRCGELDIHLLLEPGRSIVGPAGVLLTSIVYKKSNNGKKFLIVDAAMNDLIRPALYGAYHEIVPVTLHADPLAKSETADIVGPVCETGRLFRARSNTAHRGRGRPARDSRRRSVWNGAGFKLQHAASPSRGAGFRQVCKGHSAPRESIGPAAPEL